MGEQAAVGGRAVRTAVRVVLRLPAWALIGVFRLWQLLVSPTYGQTCRFYPSCSSYGVESVRVHGALRGLALTAWRVLRCNPWNPGGVDTVPPRGGSLFRRPAAPESTHPHDAHESAPSGPAECSCPDEPAPSRRRVA